MYPPVSLKDTEGLIGPSLFPNSKEKHHRPVWVPSLLLCRVTRNFPMAIRNQIPKKLALEPIAKARQISSEDSLHLESAASYLTLFETPKELNQVIHCKPGPNSLHSRCRVSFDIHSDTKENKPRAKSASQEISTSATIALFRQILF